jgi:hypothetical protein
LRGLDLRWLVAGSLQATTGASNAGEAGPNTITPQLILTSTLIPGPALLGTDSDGHASYATTTANAHDIYSDTDPGWQRLRPRSLVSFSSLAGRYGSAAVYYLH